MSITELKRVCSELINQIEDKNFLKEFYEVLKNYNDNKGVDFWNELTDDQKKDLEDAWIESEDENNLISHEDVMKKAKVWLKK